VTEEGAEKEEKRIMHTRTRARARALHEMEETKLCARARALYFFLLSIRIINTVALLLRASRHVAHIIGDW
jgi:hypothetical protein